MIWFRCLQCDSHMYYIDYQYQCPNCGYVADNSELGRGTGKLIKSIFNFFKSK